MVFFPPLPHPSVRALLPTFYSPLDEEGTITAAEKTLTFCLNSYPDSALFKWVEGRWKRRMRDPLAAADSLMSVATTSSELVQLQHVAAYELALTAFYSGTFAPAGLLLRFLFTHCPWSRRFFSYMAAVRAFAIGAGPQCRSLTRLCSHRYVSLWRAK